MWLKYLIQIFCLSLPFRFLFSSLAWSPEPLWGVNDDTVVYDSFSWHSMLQ